MLLILSRTLNIRKDEWRIFLSFLTLTMLIGLGSSWGRSISMGLFISNVGSEGLPIYYIIRDIGVMIFSTLYTILAARLSSGRITQIFSIWIIAILGGVWVYLNLLNGDITPLMCYILTIGFQIGYIMLSIHMGSYVSYHFNAMQRKRLNVLIFAGLTIGSVIGGGLYNILASGFGISSNQLTLGIVIFFIGTIFMVLYITRNFEMVVKPSGKKKKKLEAVADGFVYFRKSRLMFFMALTMLVFFALAAVMDFQFNHIFQNYFQSMPQSIPQKVFDEDVLGKLPTADDRERIQQFYIFDESSRNYILSADLDMYQTKACKRILGTAQFRVEEQKEALTSFYALYELIANALAMFVQILITPRIIASFGVGSSNFIYPGLNIMSAIFLMVNSFFPILPLLVGSFSKLVNSESRKTIQTPTRSLLFNGIPSNLWPNVNAFFSSVVNPLGTFLGAFILLWVLVPLTSSNSSLFFLAPLVSMVLAILFFFFAIPQKKSYETSVLKLLENRSFDKDSLAQLDLGKLDDKTYKLVTSLLESDEIDRVNLGIELVSATRDPRLLSFFGEKYEQVGLESKKKFIEAISQFETQAAYQLLYTLLEQDQTPESVYAILDRIALRTEIDHKSKIQPYLEHDYIPLRFVSRKVLYKNDYATDSERNEIVNYLERVLKSERDPDTLVEALKATRELKIRKLLQPVMLLSKERNPSVQHEALRGLVVLCTKQDQSVFSHFLDLLDNSDRTISYVCLEGIQKFIPIESGFVLHQLFKYLDSRYPNHKRLVKTLITNSINEIKDYLYGELFAYYLNSQQKQDIFYILAETNMLVEEDLLQLGEHQFRMMIKSLMWLNFIDSFVTKDGSRGKSFIEHIIFNKYADFATLLIAVVVQLGKENRKTAEMITAGFLSDDTNNQGNALEAVSNLNERNFGNKLTEFSELNTRDSEVISAFYSKHFHIPYEQPPIEEILDLWVSLEDPYLTSALIFMFKENNLTEYIEKIKELNQFEDELIEETLDYVTNN